MALTVVLKVVRCHNEHCFK